MSTNDAPETTREVEPEQEARIQSWFRTLGLADGNVLARAAREVATAMRAEGIDQPVPAARLQLDRWLASITDQPVPPGALERLLETEPSLLFDTRPEARERARGFLKTPAELPSAGRWRPARWTMGRALGPAVGIGAVGSLLFLWAQAQDHGGVFGASASAILFVLTTLHALGAVLTLWGVQRRVQRRQRAQRAIPKVAPPDESGPRTVDTTATLPSIPRSALILFLYGEDTEKVFPALAAMREALSHAPDAENLELFILSDTREPMQVMEERRCVRRLRREAGMPVYYRRREENANYKTGNFAEFLMRWGNRYEFVGVLDADSIIPAKPLLGAFRRMAGSSRLGLLQLPIEPMGAETLFARALQFDAALVGPYHTSGLAAWAGKVGNYYGHNAVIRTRAFIETCALPRLSGTPPLGGLVLSHDFVEAAAMARGGWEVRIADELDPSYEELPASVEAYLDRDRRWCQGNLQHLRIMGTRGLRGMSRLHLFLGALSYLASPVWFVFIVLMALAGTWSSPGALEVGILIASIGLLLVPRLLSVLDASETGAFGHPLRLIASALVQTVLMALMAPIFMVHHTTMVLSAFIGGAVGWTSKKKKDTQNGLVGVVSRHSVVTAVGALGFGLSLWNTELGLWLSPIWIPCLFAIPLVTLMNSAAAGRLASRLGLLQTPIERCPLPIFDHVEAWRSAFVEDESVCFRDLVLEPKVRPRFDPNQPSETSSEKLEAWQAAVLARGADAVGARERMQLLSDPTSMARLHEGAWASWPVRAMSLTSEPPLTPPGAPVEQSGQLTSIAGDAA